MSVWTVRAAAARAIAHARAGEGPAFVEALTYRFVGHSRSDPGAYRPDGELERWKERDPILVLRTQLEAEGVDGASLEDLERSVTSEMERMRERALAAPFPGRAHRPRVQGLTRHARRADDAQAVGLDGGRCDPPLVEVARGVFRARRCAIEVETDKATVVYEAESDGTLGSILVPEGATVAVGEPIATLATAMPPSHRTVRGVRTRRRSPGGPRSSSASRFTDVRRHRAGRSDNRRGRDEGRGRRRRDTGGGCEWRQG